MFIWYSQEGWTMNDQRNSVGSVVASNQLLWCSRLIFSDCWLDWPPHSPDLNPMEHLLFLWHWDLRFQSVPLNFLSSVCIDKRIYFGYPLVLCHINITATLLQADLRLHRCIHSAGIKGLSGGTEEVWGRRRHTFYVVISLPSFTDASHRWIQSVGRGEQARSEVTARKSAAHLYFSSHLYTTGAFVGKVFETIQMK